MKSFFWFASSLFLLSLLPFTVTAAPNLVNYQGVLTNNTGAPVTSATQAMTFRLYDAATGGTLLWQEVRTVDVQNGSYSLLLGSVTSFPADLFQNDSLWLEIVVGSEVMGKRQRLASAPFAQQAQSANTAQNVVDGGISSAAIADASVTSGKISVPLQLSGSEMVSVINSVNNRAEGAAIHGTSSPFTGTGKGVSGESRSPNGYGVHGVNGYGGYAGYFEGKVHATGSISGSFSGNGSGLTNVNAQTIEGVTLTDLNRRYASTHVLDALGYQSSGVDNLSLVIPGDRLPVFTYIVRDMATISEGRLFLGKCADARCLAGSRNQLYSGQLSDARMVVGSDGLPLIALAGTTNGEIIHCRDASCSTADLPVPISLTMTNIFLALDEKGLPVLTDGDSVWSCSDLACTETTQGTINVAATGYVMVAGNGIGPLFIYRGNPTELWSRQCLDSACLSSSPPNFLINATWLPSAIGINGAGVPSFVHSDASSLMYHECGDASCSFLLPDVTLASPASVANKCTLGFTGRGQPMATFNSGGSLRLAVCDEPSCGASTLASIGTISAAGASAAVAESPDGTPVVIYSANANPENVTLMMKFQDISAWAKGQTRF